MFCTSALEQTPTGQPCMRSFSRLLCLLVCLLLSGLLLPGLSRPALSQQPRRDAVEMWIMQGMTETQLKQRMLAQGQQKYDEVKQMLEADNCSFTEQQDNKLQLALKGVISRRFQEIANARAATESLDMNKQDEQQKAIQVVIPVRQKIQNGQFEKDSLFEGVLAQTLDERQKAIIETHRLEKIAKRHHAFVLKTVADLDERLAFVKTQREKLVQLMDEQVLKPNRISGNVEMYVGYFKIHQIPESELSKFLDAQQIRSLKHAAERYRGFLLR